MRLPSRACSGPFPVFFLVFSGFLRLSVRFPCIVPCFLRFSALSSDFLFFLVEHASNAKLHLVLAFLAVFRGPGFQAVRSIFFCFPIFFSSSQRKSGFLGCLSGARFPSSSSIFLSFIKIRTFWPDSGPELPGDLPKRTLLV